MSHQSTVKLTHCLCGRQLSYADCCQPWHRGQSVPDAETLMRSRYSAYVLKLEDYLLRTWHHSTRPGKIDFNADTDTKWIGLEVRFHAAIDKDSAIVNFVARYKVGGRAQRLEESSRFVREIGQWFYLNGDIQQN